MNRNRPAYPIMLERGFSEYTVVAAMTIIGPAQVAGRVFVMAFGKQAIARRIGSLVVIGFPIAMGLFASAPAAFWFVAFAAINGALVVPMTVSRALAPLAAAAMWSATGSYATTMTAVVALAVLMVITFWAAAATHRGKGPRHFLRRWSGSLSSFL